MTDRDLMQQALDALKLIDEARPFPVAKLTIKNLNERLAQPEQEPVAWMVYTQEGQSVYVTDNPTDIQESQRALPLYTTPPQRKPLTDEWIHRTTILMGFNPEWTTEIGIAYAIVRAAEAAHNIKEKNNGN